MRRHDLDWLRVLVFGLLIFYHVGMFFVPWGWHIKNNEIYDWLRYPMIFLNQWRLPILFVISGMGTAYALSFRTASQFIKERFLRLFIPLAFGMLMIVPPQVYVERLVDGVFQGTYSGWLVSGAFLQGVYPEGNFSWHHLWFLPYLLVFSILLTPVFVRLRSHPSGKMLSWLRESISTRPYFLFVFVVPLYFYEALLEPFFEVTHNLVWDWFNFTSSLTLFFYGFLMIAIGDVFWQAVDRIRNYALLTGVISFTSLLLIWLTLEDSTLVHFVEALIKVTNLWAWILAILGLGARFLNHQSRQLTYANQAVYPFYILHQTITIIIGYYLMDLDWSLALKATIMLLGTFGGAWVIYEFLIRRWRWVRPLFGLKKAA